MVALGTSQKPIGWNIADVEQGAPLEPRNTEITPVHQQSYSGYNGADFNRVTRTPSSESLRDREDEEKTWINCCTVLAIVFIICIVVYVLCAYGGGGSSSGYHSGYHSSYHHVSHIYHSGGSHSSSRGHSSHGHGHSSHGGHRG